MSVVAYRYDAWGRPTGTTTQATSLIARDLAKEIAGYQVLHWPGYLYDNVMGLYWADGRWYDPAMRQFITVDDSMDTRGSHRLAAASTSEHHRLPNYKMVEQPEGVP